MKNKHMVVMLPTEKASNIYLWDDRYYFTSNPENITNVGGYNKKPTEFQHLYILSDEEIKEGDWFLLNNCNPIQCVMKDFPKAIDTKKIIATTNKSLIGKQIGIGIDEPIYEELPQIPESFLPIFVEAYNEGKPINEVILKYDSILTQRGVDDMSILDDANQPYPNPPFKSWYDYILKTTSDNEIIISLPKVKLYTRDEVAELCSKAYWDGNLNKGDIIPEDWIKENL